MGVYNRNFIRRSRIDPCAWVDQTAGVGNQISLAHTSVITAGGTVELGIAGIGVFDGIQYGGLSALIFSGDQRQISGNRNGRIGKSIPVDQFDIAQHDFIHLRIHPRFLPVYATR